jgi:hypothetical protein
MKFTLNKIGNWQQLLLLTNWLRAALQNVQVDRETIRLQAALLNTIRVIEMRCLDIRAEP